VVSSPALAGGIVYFASYDGKFSILSSPVVVKDVVYVGSTDGNMYALD
jgi:hypothetical protein